MGDSQEIAVKALLSGLASGLMSIFATRVVEKLGGVKGSILGFVPTVVVPASIGIALVADTDQDFQQSMLSIPCTMLINASYLYLWRVVPERLPESYSRNKQLIYTFLITLAYWCTIACIILALLSQLIQPAGITYVWIFSCCCYACKLSLGCFVVTFRSIPSPAGKNKVSFLVLMSRGIVTGTMTTVGVIVSHENQFAGGIVSTFPAIFATTMVALWMAQGQSVQHGAVGPMMVASSSVSFYAILISALKPYFNLPEVVAIAWFASLFYQVPIGLFLYRSAKKHGPNHDGNAAMEAEMHLVDPEAMD
eukprot:TRINITY_DN13589_c0_g1_i1.p1 TRINITY_DN13589_c0_g1~~TRINITY_DN13589_c0_g1_i1.p1  ORF type:complete len:308 (-),score=62.26 TRINITY_DN13589_c0_g1_i1:132-1055(-)